MNRGIGLCVFLSLMALNLAYLKGMGVAVPKEGCIEDLIASIQAIKTDIADHELYECQYTSIINRLQKDKMTVKACLQEIARFKKNEAIAQLKGKNVTEAQLKQAKRAGSSTQLIEPQKVTLELDMMISKSLKKKIMAQFAQNLLPGKTIFRINDNLVGHAQTRLVCFMRMSCSENSEAACIHAESFGHEIDINSAVFANSSLERCTDVLLKHLLLEMNENVYFACCSFMLQTFEMFATKNGLDQFDTKPQEDDYWKRIKAYEADWMMMLENETEGAEIVSFLKRQRFEDRALTDIPGFGSRIEWLEKIAELCRAEKAFINHTSTIS